MITMPDYAIACAKLSSEWGSRLFYCTSSELIMSNHLREHGNIQRQFDHENSSHNKTCEISFEPKYENLSHEI